jgi:hypothetical protein
VSCRHTPDDPSQSVIPAFILDHFGILGTKGPLYWLQESQTSRYLSRMMNFSVFLNVNIAGILAPDPDRFSGPKRGFSRILKKQ